ncbi:unnamed protein product, partial [Larinioides sclopetarius]
HIIHRGLVYKLIEIAESVFCWFLRLKTLLL